MILRSIAWGIFRQGEIVSLSDVLFVDGGMDFNDIAAGELDDGGGAGVCFVGGNEDDGAGSFGFFKGDCEVGDFVTGGFAAVRIGEVAGGDNERHFTESGFYADAAIGFGGDAD